MSLLDRWHKWRATPPLMRQMLREAACELLLARLVVAFALKRSLPSLLEPQAPDDPAPSLTLQRDLRYIFALAAARVPWRSVCLPNAIAARRMLRRRGFGSTLHLGVGFKATQELHAHAWLEAGGMVITGEQTRETVVPLPFPAASSQIKPT